VRPREFLAARVIAFDKPTAETSVEELTRLVAAEYRPASSTPPG
jgi:hypothetical protein